MQSDQAVLFSFGLYVLYVLLPLIPAVMIFRMFPEATVVVSGPLQGLSVRAGGAFAGYVVAVVLGFVPVQYVQQRIAANDQFQQKQAADADQFRQKLLLASLSRNFHFEGNIDLGADPKTQSLVSDDFFARSETIGGGSHPGNPNLHFVVLLSTPTESKRISFRYYSGPPAAGVGPPPTREESEALQKVPFEMVPFEMDIAGANLQAQKFKLRTDTKPPSVVQLVATQIVARNGITATPLSAGMPNLDWFIHPTPAPRNSGAKEALASFTPIPDAPIEKNSDDPAPLGFQAPMSNRCVTPGFFCFLPAYGPIGAPCWCASPYGPVAGVVR